MSTRAWIAAACGLLGYAGAWSLDGSVAAQGPASADAPAVVGAPLPSWAPGVLDIHQIATGRGNAALVVMPDGTAMLVDAGAVGDGVPQTDPHPDATRTPGAWVARYVRRHLPAGAAGLDYALVTHFHPDHIGQPRPDSAREARGRFLRAGISEVLDEIPTTTLIDRGAPSYDYPAAADDPMMRNYKAFVAARLADGLVVERFRVGVADQILPRRTPAAFDVEVRNIVANGEMWTGSGTATRSLFPPLASLPNDDIPSENMCSLGVRLRYGAFRYFTGGDLPGAADPGFPAWHALEPAVAPVIGRVDVHVTPQHGSMGQESDAFIDALRSTVIVIPSWQPSHPAPDVLKRLMNSRLAPTPRHVYATDLREATKIVIGQRATRLAGPTGHIIVRVERGGRRYWVITTDATDERDIVTSVRGPFVSGNV